MQWLIAVCVAMMGFGPFPYKDANPMPTWPKDKLLKHGPDLPLEERIRRYQHNIRTIRKSGCKVPTSAFIDTLDPTEIELWFADKAFTIDRLKRVMKDVADLPEGTLLPSPFIPLRK
ncbi:MULTISPECIES: hypothetical protein [Rhizobium/Agrobacterium group]|uniref:Uncharacterized protein n=3 Tax=Rhizobium/Agrobacterium group TaxID=227290 RepID=A0A1C7P7V7_9HYPH|nr:MULTISPECIES: hypothetical protein [Rhizobium/Agrobacterium group]KJF65409.1 hypothetical protein RS75_23310 [Rhizobium nepotum 39/7]OBZ97332.1 hypothetical protein ADU59_00885 [Pararhizobium polonicum]